MLCTPTPTTTHNNQFTIDIIIIVYYIANEPYNYYQFIECNPTID